MFLDATGGITKSPLPTPRPSTSSSSISSSSSSSSVSTITAALAASPTSVVATGDSQGLSEGAKIGIGLGVPLGVLLLAGVVMLLLRTRLFAGLLGRRRRRSEPHEVDGSPSSAYYSGSTYPGSASVGGQWEYGRSDLSKVEAYQESPPVEADATPRNVGPWELPP